VLRGKNYYVIMTCGNNGIVFILSHGSIMHYIYYNECARTQEDGGQSARLFIDRCASMNSAAGDFELAVSDAAFLHSGVVSYSRLPEMVQVDGAHTASYA